MKLARKRKRMEATVELNITAFLNLMVILVPFLLITAVFSRMTVLELNLPALDAQQAQNPDQAIKLQLQIVLRPESIVIQDGTLGPIKTIARLLEGVPVEDEQRDIWKPLRETLIELKTRFPDAQNVTLLLHRKVSYNDMIQLMDRVRTADIVNAATLETVELFPQISIGDIPEDPAVVPETQGPETQGSAAEPEAAQ